MGVESPFYCSRANTFARALAYKYMIPVGAVPWLTQTGPYGVSTTLHYQQSLAHWQFAATGGATGPRASCVTGSPSTLPFSHSALQCHRITRDALPTITRPVRRDRRRDRAARRGNLRRWESIYPTIQSIGPAIPPGHPRCHWISTWNSWRARGGAPGPWRPQPAPSRRAGAMISEK